MDMLSLRLGEDAPERFTYKDAKRTYEYRGNRRFPMLQLCFSSLKSMEACARLLSRPLKTDDWGFIQCHVWENSISIVRKLLTVRDVRYSQWFRVTGAQVEPEMRISSLEREYIAEWDSMVAVPPDECAGWMTQPGVLAFDIECYSNNHRAMPDKYNALHVAYMISCIYQRHKDPSTRRRFGIIIGDCNHIPPDKFENCEIIKVESEYAMIEAFADVIRRTDPEIVTGYNILGFDYPYLDHRVKRWLKEWPEMGRISGEKSHMTSKNWKSGAYGYQSINILQMEGRISIDLLPIVKRDFKLDKYDLNFVCKKFIGKSKHDVSAPEMFLIYEDMRNTLQTIVALHQRAKDKPELQDDPQFRRDFAQAERDFATAKAETTRVMEYCIQDSELVIELLEKMNIWIGLTELSNIVGTTIVELFTRGQQIRCISQLYDLAARKGFVLDRRDVKGCKFSGGFVYEPIPGLYDNIICLDFASLYPSIMQAFNISYETFVPEDLMDVVPDEDCHVIEFDQEEEVGGDDEDEDEDEFLQEINVSKQKKKPVIVTKHYKYKFFKGFEGLLPCLVRTLVAERRAVNRQVAIMKDQCKALEKREDMRAYLEAYLTGKTDPVDIDAAKAHIKALSTAVPPAPPEVITQAKFVLELSQLLNPTAMAERLQELSEAVPPAHPDLVSLAQFGAQIAAVAGDRAALHQILDQLNQTRADRAVQIDGLKLKIIVYTQRGLAIKVSANSFFGFLGVHEGGLMPLIEGARSITAKGRELIGAVREYIEQTYGGIQIYGDTDSVMVSLPHIKDGKECNYWGIRLAQEISGIKAGEKDCDGKVWPQGRPGLFGSPVLTMEFEKAMRLLCLKKKKYAALLVAKDGSFKTEDITDKHGNVIGNQLMMLKKGIVLARRDNCPFLRKTYTKILDMIMKRRPLEEAIDVLVEAVRALLDGNVPPEDLLIIRELGANYKSDSYFMKVFAGELEKAGKIVNPGDRLDFLIVENPHATLLGQKMKLGEQYRESLETGTPYQIDYTYYIEKVLMNPVNQLFKVGFKDVIAELQHVFYKPNNRHKAIHLDRPVQIILKLRERGHDIAKFQDAVRYNMDRFRERQAQEGKPPPSSPVPSPPGVETTPVYAASSNGANPSGPHIKTRLQVVPCSPEHQGPNSAIRVGNSQVGCFPPYKSRLRLITT
jgi:DNA polymerase elongation subunit (family B)